MSNEVIGEEIKTFYIEEEFDVDTSSSYSDEEIEISDFEKPLPPKDFKITSIEKSFGTNFFPLSYYRQDDDDLRSLDGSSELDLDPVQEYLQYEPEKDSESDEEYRNSVWHRVINFMEGDYIEALKARIQEKCPPFPVARNLEILNFIIIQDFKIIIYGIIPLADILLYLEKNPVQLMDPAFSAFTKTMQIIMRNSGSLEDNYRIKILHLLNRDKTIIENLELSATRHFLVNLLTFIPKFETDPEAVTFEGILRIIHEIYLEYMHQSDIIEGITSLETTNVLHKVLRNTNAIISVKYCVMEILSIICANYSEAASNLLGNNIHQTLIDLDQQYKFKIEAVKMHLVTFIWSLLPLPCSDIFDINDDVRELTFKTENVIKMAVWHKEIESGIWVPFIPRLNYLIEQSYRENIKEFTYYDHERIYTVDFIHMVIIDETMSERTPVSREEKDIITPLFLTKRRRCILLIDRKEPAFVNFAYKFLTRRFPLSLYHQEKYYCMEALLSIMKFMDVEQRAKLLFCANPKKYVWRVDQLVQISVKLLKQNPMYCQMFAVQTFTFLGCYHNSLSKRIDVHGIGILLQNFSEEKENSFYVTQEYSSLELEFVKWIKDQVEEYTSYFNLENACYPSYVGSNISKSYGGITQTKQVLEYYKLSFFDEENPDILNRRSEAIKYFIWYLTGPTESDHRICRMRVFLDVFFGIPVQPQGQEFNWNSQLFKELVKKIGYFLVDHEDEDYKNLNKIFRTSINTFGRIATRVFQIMIRITPSQEEISLTVRPFTTIQFLQHFMFSRKHESSYHGWSIVPNKRFATKATFSLNGILLSPQMTIYEIIMKYGVVGHESNVFDHQYIFLYQQYEVHFPPNEENNPDLNEEIMKPTYLLENYLKPRSSECEELTEEVENALHLTNILYGINEHWTSAYEQIQHPKVLIDPQDFVNTRLNKCVFKRLLDPFAALMGKYPPWIKYIFDHCPFVFPLGTRIFGFRVLYLNRVRALHSVLWKYERYNLAVYIYETIITLSIERSDIVNDVKKYIFHTRPSLFWGVVFNNEIGAGRGLRKELFNSIGKELQKDKYNIWTSTEETQNGYVQFNEGLYPKLDFCSHLDFYDESSSDGADLFITIGALLAKALMECSLLGLPLATPIFKYLLNQHFPLDFDDLKYVNPAVHKVLENIRKLITERDKILDNNELTHSEKLSLVKNLTINGDNLECYNLNFVLPGHEGIELIPDGANTSVDIMNAHVYVDAIMKKLFVGVQKQMSALKWGFDHVIQFSNLHMFHPKELQYIILGEEDDSSYWSYENLTNHVQLEYCTVDDIEIQDLFHILSSANKETRRNFLEFVTGGSRLPMGGFAELNPKLTIVLVGEYPSAQTCFRLLRLQRGMDHSELKKFIEEIIPEALNYFGLV